jgi:hypothetical protein
MGDGGGQALAWEVTSAGLAWEAATAGVGMGRGDSGFSFVQQVSARVREGVDARCFFGVGFTFSSCYRFCSRAFREKYLKLASTLYTFTDT